MSEEDGFFEEAEDNEAGKGKGKGPGVPLGAEGAGKGGEQGQAPPPGPPPGGGGKGGKDGKGLIPPPVQLPPDPHGMWPTDAELQGWTRVVEARHYVGITDAPLQALLERLGAWDPSKNMEDQPMRLHMLAQMHPSVVGELNWNVAIATGSPDPEGRVPYRRATNYESLQLDLIYGIARRKMGQEDTDPYGAWLQMHTAAANYDPQYGGRVQQQANNQWAQGGAWAPPAPPPQAVAAQKTHSWRLSGARGQE